MRFKVLKSGPDGISGEVTEYANIEDVLREIRYYKGRPSLESLHTYILKWSYKVRPGDVYCTQDAAIIAVAANEYNCAGDECHHCGHKGLEYGGLDQVRNRDIEQKVKCSGCGECWLDVFTLTELRSLHKE